MAASGVFSSSSAKAVITLRMVPSTGCANALRALEAPLRTAAGEVTDYRIDAATPQAVDVSGRTGRDMVGRLILESYPSVAGEPS